MHNSNMSNIAKQLFLLELEHNHYLKVVKTVEKFLTSPEDERDINELFDVFETYETAKRERIQAQSIG